MSFVPESREKVYFRKVLGNHSINVYFFASWNHVYKYFLIKLNHRYSHGIDIRAMGSNYLSAQILNSKLALGISCYFF